MELALRLNEMGTGAGSKRKAAEAVGVPKGDTQTVRHVSPLPDVVLDPSDQMHRRVGYVLHGARVNVRLNDPEMKPYMDELNRRVREEADFALDFMVQAGIWTPKGNLKKRFGG